MYGLARGPITLIGAAGAGVLLWLASRTDHESLGGYWAMLGLIAAAGLALALSQLLGGWTKWGWPRVSVSVFLLGFLPALVVGGLVLLHAQPQGTDAWGRGWAGGLGADGLADDLTSVVPAIALGLGLLFGFIFDTTGLRVRQEVIREPEEVPAPAYVAPTTTTTTTVDTAADEPVTAERPVATTEAPVVDRDLDAVDDRTEAYAGAATEPITPPAEEPETPRRDTTS
jgi:hypothetical protein